MSRAAAESPHNFVIFGNMPSETVTQPIDNPPTLRRLHAVNSRQIEALADVLIDCVEGGASVSFMLPISRETAISFWKRVAATVSLSLRNERLDSIPFARVRVAMSNIDTTVSANARGLVLLTLPFGRAHFVVSSKPVHVDALPDQPSDVVFFLKPGKDPLYMKVALGDLGHRMAVGKFFSFTANYAQLNHGNSKTVYDALIASGLLSKNKMVLGNRMCLFVNGLARPGFMISTQVERFPHLLLRVAQFAIKKRGVTRRTVGHQREVRHHTNTLPPQAFIQTLGRPVRRIQHQ